MPDVPDLRTLAANYGKAPGPVARINRFVDSLDDAWRAAVLDLLVDQPDEHGRRNGDTRIADTLNDQFRHDPIINAKRVSPNEVYRWRLKNLPT